MRNPPSSNITQFNFFFPQIIFRYPFQSVCEFSNPLKHFKRPKIQKNPFCSLPPSFLLLKYYPSLSTLITLYWIQLLKSNKNQNKIQLIINQFQFIHCWYSDCSDLQSNSKKICQKCSIWDSKKKHASLNVFPESLFLPGFLHVFPEQVNPKSNKIHLNTASFNENKLNNQFISHNLTYFIVLWSIFKI